MDPRGGFNMTTTDGFDMSRHQRIHPYRKSRRSLAASEFENRSIVKFNLKIK